MLIPANWLSFLSIIGGVLCLAVIWKLPQLTRASMLQIYRIGLLLLSPALITFGGLYIYIANYETIELVRQELVRLLLFYLFIAIDIWQLILLRFGKKL